MIKARYGSPSAPHKQGLALILDGVAEELSRGGRHTVEALDALCGALLKSWRRNDVAAWKSAGGGRANAFDLCPIARGSHDQAGVPQAARLRLLSHRAPPFEPRGTLRQPIEAHGKRSKLR